VKQLLEKLGSRKLGVTAIAAATAGTGIVELSWPMAAVCCCYLMSQALVDSRA